MLKRVTASLFLISWSWLNLFISPPTALAARKTADEIYVQPIDGLEDNGLFGPSQSKIVESLIMDNYQVYCAAPAQKMSAQIGKNYLRYLEFNYGKMKTHDITTTMNGSDNIFNPLILDDSGEEKTAVFNDKKPSYVQYLNNSKVSDEELEQNLVSADYYKLASLEEQLALKKRAKNITIYLCSKLDVPLNKCPLNITVPGIAMEIGEIEVPDYDELTKAKTKELLDSPHLKGAAYLPTTKAYGKRPAYLVTCVEQQKSGASDARGNDTNLESLALYMKTGWHTALSSLFGGLSKELDFKKDECHVRTILVDAAGTEDKPWNSVESHNFSRNFFTSYEDQKIQEEAYKKARGARKEIAKGEVAKKFTADDRINLVSSSNDQTKALVHMINGLAPVCDRQSIRTETAPTITSEANFPKGGGFYHRSGNTADEDWGLLGSLFAKLEAKIETGKRTLNDLSNRSATLETFLIAPYDAQITMDQFFSPLEEYTITREQAATVWPTHVLFNQGVGEGQEYRLRAGTTKSSQKFDDPDDCKWIDEHEGKDGEWIMGHWDCTKEYSVSIEGANQPLGVDVIAAKTRGNIRPMLSLLPQESLAHKFVERYSSTDQANNEILIKGEGENGNSNGEIKNSSDLNSICEVANYYNIDCDFFKAIYAVETCSGSFMPTYKDKCCNSKGFCGPMQFAGSMVETVAPGEGLKVCKTEEQGMDNFILAARWMLIKKWCNSDPKTCLSIPNPYDWKNSYIESQGNSNITTRKEVEEFIIGWYGSINQIEQRIGWPEGSTYVDAVMEYLKTGSLWGGCGYTK